MRSSGTCGDLNSGDNSSLLHFFLPTQSDSGLDRYEFELVATAILNRLELYPAKSKNGKGTTYTTYTSGAVGQNW